MFMEERQQQIAASLQQNGKITVAEIVSRYGVSDESARRDLRLLEQQGLCRRTHGGAILPAQVASRPAPDRDFESMPVLENYRQIARAAAQRICENDTIYLTGGSLGWLMTGFLPRDILFTAVVNAVDIGKALRGFSNIETYLAGGKMRPSGSLVDSLAAEFVGRLHFDRCFLTGAGLTAACGLSNGTAETAAFQRAVLHNSRRRYLLLPGVKVGSDAFIKVCDAACFDELITDCDCPQQQIDALQEKGVTVTVTEAPV